MLSREELEKMRSVINLNDEYFIKKEFLEYMFSNLNLPNKNITTFLNPCWGHGPVTFGCDVIDGPEKLFKLDCDTCMAPYIESTCKKESEDNCVDTCKCM